MIWNPHALTILGLPSQLGAAPPVLRTIGGAASVEQLAMAQAVFARFCDVVRTSQVPNPAAHGRLQDGTPYRIAVVGNTTVMTVWVAQGETEDRKALRGISFQLMHAELFDGPRTPIPQHSDKNGAPLTYVLMPQETSPGSRVSSGEFRIGTVEKAEGGMIVKSDQSGGKYICGFNEGGRTHYPNRLFRQKHFVSLEESMWTASHANGVPDANTGGDGRYHSGSKPVGAGGDVQFIYTSPRGEAWIFGITTSAVSVSGAGKTHLKFYATPWSKATKPGNYVDDFLKWEGDIDEALWAQSLTFSADGSRGNVHYGYLGSVGVLEFTFSPTGLSFTKSPKQQEEYAVVDSSPPPIDESNSYGFYDEKGNWIVTHGDNLKESATDIEKTTTFAEVGDYFSRDGAYVGRSRQRVVESSRSQQRTAQNYVNKYTPDMPPSSTTTQYDASSEITKTDAFLSNRYGSTYQERYTIQYEEFDNGVAAEFYRKGASVDTLHSVDVRTLFLDDALTDFWVASTVETNQSKTQGIDFDGYGVNHGAYVSDNIQKFDLVFKHLGREIYREEIFRIERHSSGTGNYQGEGDPVQYGIDSSFVTLAAVDAKTDCMLVVVDKYHSIIDPADGRLKNIFDAEWVYVVGKNYAKPLHEVMNMAPGARITGLKTI